jgi:hypothetical protein
MSNRELIQGNRELVVNEVIASEGINISVESFK